MIVAYPEGSKRPIKVNHLVNRGKWWGETWLLSVAIANALNPVFVVEAGDEQDAIDEFVDSKYGHLITLSEEDAAEVDEDYRSYGGNYGVPITLDYVSLFRCKVDYFYKPNDELW